MYVRIQKDSCDVTVEDSRENILRKGGLGLWGQDFKAV